MHRNQWASPLEAFVPAEWWQACQAQLPEVGQFESWVMAVDAGVSSDCFAVVCVAVKDGKVTQRYTRKWEPRKGDTIDFAEPEAEIRRLCKDHRIEQITYDPYQLHDMMTRLKRDGVAWIDPFGQSAERLRGDKLFYDLIRERRYQHDGHPDMTEHILNANAKKDGENKLRIVKRSELSKVDLAVAAAMASARAIELAI